jgi:hypothetical protein
MAEFQEHICPACGIVYGLTSRFVEGRRESKDTFYCPNGHSLSFKKSKSDQLAEELSRARQQLAHRDETIQFQANRLAEKEKTIVGMKGQATKLRKRISAGTCPCCHRNFGNLANHMKHKHPNFLAEAAE